jgi:hypothetical protein
MAVAYGTKGTYIKQNGQDFYFRYFFELWYSYCLFACVFTLFEKYVMNVEWVPLYDTSLQYIFLLHTFLSMMAEYNSRLVFIRGCLFHIEVVPMFS